MFQKYLNMLQGKWFIPTTDLVNIYAMLGISVQESWITECAVIFYAGVYLYMVGTYCLLVLI